MEIDIKTTKSFTHSLEWDDDEVLEVIKDYMWDKYLAEHFDLRNINIRTSIRGSDTRVFIITATEEFYE